MIKNTVTLLFCLLLGFNIEISSQVNVGGSSDHEILQKYWYYRWRLRNDFVYIGDQPGESLLISDRNIYGGNSMGVGDVTQLLGYYISTLATEHKLLTETNRFQDLPMTRTELYYAFKASEIEQTDMPLGKIELILVEKVEEMTLHLIDLNKSYIQLKTDFQNLNLSNEFLQKYMIEINKANENLKLEIELLKKQNELLQQNMDAKK